MRYSELEAQKTLARTIIASNVEPKLHSLFLFCGSKEPFEIWRCLQSKLQPRDYNAKLQVRIDLWGCKQKTNESIVEYSDRINELSLRLNELSNAEVVTDLDKISVLYRGLAPKYKNIVNAVKATEKHEEKSFNQVVSNFKSIDISEETPGRDNINLFLARNRGVYRGRGRGRGRGSFRGARNRFSNYNNRDGSEFKNIECFNCGKKGHKANQCRNRKENPNSANAPRQSVNVEEKYKSQERRVALALFSKLTRRENIWCVDTGSVVHVCNNINIFKTVKPIAPITLTVGNSDHLVVNTVGDVDLVSYCNGERFIVSLCDVHYCPKAPCNLIAPIKFNPSRTGMYFKNGICIIFVWNADGSTTDIIKTDGNYTEGYYAYLPPVGMENEELEGSNNEISCLIVENNNNNNNNFLTENKYEINNNIPANNSNVDDKLRNDILLYHNIHGHPNIRKTIKLMNISVDKNFVLPVCSSCQLAKSNRKKFNNFSNADRRGKHVGDLVHSDIIGPLPPTNKYKYKYILTFIDDFSGYAQVYMLQDKNAEHVVKYFDEFYNLIYTQHNKRIKIVRSDNGSEYISNEFKTYETNKGITHQYTHTYTPQQNGRAERYNRSLMECANALRFTAGMGQSMWGLAVDAACYLLNRLPSTRLGNHTPYELFFNMPPDSREKAVLGCECFVHIPKQLRHKLDPKAIRCILVGYSIDKKGYACLGLDDNHIYMSRDVRFNNNVFPLKQAHNYSRDVISNNTVFPCKQGRSETHTGSDALVEPSDDVKDDVDPPTPQEDTKESGDTMGSEGSEDSDVDSNVNMVDRDPMLLDPARSPLFTSNHSSRLLSHAKCSEGGDFACPILPGAYGDGGGGSNIDANISVPNQDEKNGPRRSSRVTLPSREGLESIASENDWGRRKMVLSTIIEEPEELDAIDVEAALGGKSRERWLVSMKEEVDALRKNETWRLVDRKDVLAKGNEVIDGKWVLRVKKGADGKVIKYKARWVARGFRQAYGVNFTETFAPVVSLKTVRIILALMAAKGWHARHVDIDNAYLQGRLSEEVYIEEPDYFKTDTAKVCKLEKALYGLKQAGRAWNLTLANAFFEMGYKQSTADPGVFIKSNKDVEEEVNIVIVWVDDLVLIHNNNEVMEWFVGEIKRRFSAKDLGELKWFLGLQIERDWNKGTIQIDQNNYIEQILGKFGYDKVKRSLVPMPVGVPLTSGDEDSRKVPKFKYQCAVGSLMYAAVTTRPDLAISLSIVSRFSNAPKNKHYRAVEIIFKYLRGTSDNKMVMGAAGTDTELHGFCDSDWASDIDSRKSTTGYIFFIGASPVSWCSQRQNTVALSATEAEYMSISAAAREAVWLRALLYDLGMPCSGPTKIRCDNKGAVALSENPIKHRTNKHIEIRHHYIRELVEQKRVTVIWTTSKSMVADIMTKPLPRVKFERWRNVLMGFGLDELKDTHLA